MRLSLFAILLSALIVTGQERPKATSVDVATTAARSRHRAKNGAVRRLTVAQYRNTLRDLLGIEEDLTDALPPDGTSKDGFTNNAQVLALSPLQVETYFDIAEKALDQCIVDDPPPNVPQLKEDADAKLTLREKLERHRNQKGCAKCHSGIDPWGLPFESFDAGGLPKKSAGTDTRSKLLDGTEIADLNALKKYLAQERIDQVAFSVLKHLAT